jgi:hypothetical protein
MLLSVLPKTEAERGQDLQWGIAIEARVRKRRKFPANKGGRDFAFNVHSGF